MTVESVEVFDRLRALLLPAGDYAVFGSGPLIVRGLVPFTNDLDVVCRGAAWERVKGMGSMSVFDDGTEIVELDDGRLTFGVRWMLGDIDIDEVIDSAELIDGIPFARMEYVERFKRAADRPKDRRHLEIIEAWER